MWPTAVVEIYSESYSKSVYATDARPPHLINAAVAAAAALLLPALPRAQSLLTTNGANSCAPERDILLFIIEGQYKIGAEEVSHLGPPRLRDVLLARGGKKNTSSSFARRALHC